MRPTTCQALVVLSVVAWGCDGSMSLQPLGPAGVPEPAVLEAAPSRNTTSEHIAVTNLNASIQASRRKLLAGPDVGVASALVEQLMLRTDFYRNFDDWDEAVEVSRAALEAHPTDPFAFVLRARVHNTLHEFDAALALVEQARAHISRDTVVNRAELETRATHLEASIGLAQSGPVDEIVDRRRALAASLPTYQSVTSLALALAQQGRFAEADAVFRGALEHYRDVSPFPFAWVAFQRGVMWSEQAGRPDLGRPLYEEALGYLPGYVLANVHLAELDAQAGDVQIAIERIEPLVGTTQDPEPLALLATLEHSTDRARLYAVEAAAAYRDLIARFPEAFAHHAPDVDPGSF